MHTADFRFVDKCMGRQLHGDRKSDLLGKQGGFFSAGRDTAGRKRDRHRAQQGPCLGCRQPAVSTCGQGVMADAGRGRAVQIVEIRHHAGGALSPLHISGDFPQGARGEFRQRKGGDGVAREGKSPLTIRFHHPPDIDRFLDGCRGSRFEDALLDAFGDRVHIGGGDGKVENDEGIDIVGFQERRNGLGVLLGIGRGDQIDRVAQGRSRRQK